MSEQLGRPESNNIARVRRTWGRWWWAIGTICIFGGTVLSLRFRRLLPNEWGEFVTLVSAVVTLISVGIAWRAMKESRRAMQESNRQLDWLRAQSQELRGQSEKLRAQSATQIDRIEKIQADISTKYVDSFPGDMDTIISLLNSAQHEISILIDVAGYGHWSSHALFREYLLLLNRKVSQDVEIHIAMYDMPTWDNITPCLFRPKNYDEQLKDDPDLRDYVRQLKTDPKTDDYWMDLARRLNIEEPPKTVAAIETFDHFIAQLRADEVYYRKQIPGIEVYLSTTTHLPLLCWMVDGKRAVYSFIFDRSNEDICESHSGLAGLPYSIKSTEAYKRYQDTNYEITFITSDFYLIKELKTVMRSYAPSLRIDGEAGLPRSPGTDVIQPAVLASDSSQPETSYAQPEQS